LGRLRVRREVLSRFLEPDQIRAEWPGVLPSPFDPRWWHDLEREEWRLEGLLRELAAELRASVIDDRLISIQEIQEQFEYARRYYNARAFEWNQRVMLRYWSPAFWFSCCVPYFQLSDRFEMQTHRLRLGQGMWERH
jgi:hypothetical protein